MPSQTKIVNRRVRKIDIEKEYNPDRYKNPKYQEELYINTATLNMDGRDVRIDIYKTSSSGSGKDMKYTDIKTGRVLDIAESRKRVVDYAKTKGLDIRSGKSIRPNQIYGFLNSQGYLAQPVGRGGYDPTKDGYFYKQRVKYNGQEFVGFGISNVPRSRIKQYQKEREEYDYDAYFTKMWKGKGKDIASFEKELRHLIKQQNKITVDLPGFKTESMKWMHESLIEEYAKKYNLELANPDDYGAMYGEGDRSNTV